MHPPASSRTPPPARLAASIAAIRPSSRPTAQGTCTGAGADAARPGDGAALTKAPSTTTQAKTAATRFRAASSGVRTVNMDSRIRDTLATSSPGRSAYLSRLGSRPADREEVPRLRRRSRTQPPQSRPGQSGLGWSAAGEHGNRIGSLCRRLKAWPPDWCPSAAGGAASQAAVRGVRARHRRCSSPAIGIVSGWSASAGERHRPCCTPGWL